MVFPVIAIIQKNPKIITGAVIGIIILIIILVYVFKIKDEGYRYVSPGDVVVTKRGEPFTVIQGGGIPAGGIGGIYTPRFNQQMENYAQLPRAVGTLGLKPRTLKPFDLEGSDKL